MDHDESIAALSARLDALSEQIATIAEWVVSQQAREREWRDLKADVMPVANDAFSLAVEQLSELEPHVRLEDIVELLKRLARNTRHIGQALEQLTSASELLADIGPVVSEATEGLVDLLDRLDKRGYFSLGRGAARAVDEAATSLGPEGVARLGEGAGQLVTVAADLTQPDVIAVLQSVARHLRTAVEPTDASPPGLLGLLREMRDPEVRRGLAVGLQVLRGLSGETIPTSTEDYREK